MNFVKRPSRMLLAAVLLAAPLSACGALGGGSKADNGVLAVSVGRQPFAAGNSPITQYMMEHKLFEDAAKKAGQEIKVEYRDYPSAAPQVEAMIGGRLDFGMWGNTPIIRAMAQKQPISVIGVGEGNLRFILATHKDSGIKKMKDLKGKTVGLLVGGDPQLAFQGMLKGELGNVDPAASGIKITNLPTQATAATVPKGVDATVVGMPALLKQQEKDSSVVGIINSHGTTEDGYVGSEGTGAGIKLPSAADSVFAPEGFYGHRSFWVARNEIITKHPNVVQAFLTAEQQAIEALVKEDPKTVSDSVKKYWDLAPEDGAKVMQDEILSERKWVWATEGDAILLKKLSEQMAASKIIDKPLTWTEIIDGFKTPADITKKAYEAAGSVPDSSGFKATGNDARGAPQWEMDQWKDAS